MGTLEQKWGPNGNPKTEKGHHGDRVPQMGTHVATVLLTRLRGGGRQKGTMFPFFTVFFIRELPLPRINEHIWADVMCEQPSIKRYSFKVF